MKNSWFYQHSKSFLHSILPCRSSCMQLKNYSKHKFLLNPCKVTKCISEIKGNHAYFLQCTIKLIRNIKLHKNPLDKTIVIHLDIYFTIPRVQPSIAFFFSPQSNTCICSVGLLVLSFCFSKCPLELKTRALLLQGMSLRKPTWPMTRQRNAGLRYLKYKFKKANPYHNSHLTKRSDIQTIACHIQHIIFKG